MAERLLEDQWLKGCGSCVAVVELLRWLLLLLLLLLLPVAMPVALRCQRGHSHKHSALFHVLSLPLSFPPLSYP